MEIYRCSFMQNGMCTRKLNGESDIPSGARIQFVSLGEDLVCTQSPSDSKDLIVCDQKVIVSDKVVPVDNGDGSGLS